MPRRPRIEFEGAIYHVMARGNARQKIVRDDADRSRLIDGLEQTVVRHDWELLCNVVMGNHIDQLIISRSTAWKIPRVQSLSSIIRAASREFFSVELPVGHDCRVIIPCT